MTHVCNVSNIPEQAAAATDIVWPIISDRNSRIVHMHERALQEPGHTLSNTDVCFGMPCAASATVLLAAIMTTTERRPCKLLYTHCHKSGAAIVPASLTPNQSWCHSTGATTH